MELEFQELLNEGIAYMKVANYHAAEEVFQRAIKYNPKISETYIHLGNAYVNMKEYDKGIKTLKTALMLKPNDGKILFSIGSVYFIKGEIAPAIRYMNQAEQNGFKSVDLYTIRSGIFAQSEDYVQAIREVSKAIEIKPLRADLYQRKVALQIQSHQSEAALETLKEFKILMPDALEAYSLSVQIYLLRNEYKKALEIVEEGLEKFPLDPAIRLLKLGALSRGQKYEMVVEEGENLLNIPLEQGIKKQTVIYLAEAYAKVGNLNKMFDILENFTNEQKEQEVMYLLLLAYAGNGQYEKLKTLSLDLQQIASEKAIIASAKYCHAQAVEHLHGIEVAKQEYKILTSELRKMTIQNPELYEVYIYRVLSHIALEEYEKSLVLVEYLEKAYPKLDDPHVYRYHIYKRLGDTAKANEAKEKALKMNPNLKL